MFIIVKQQPKDLLENMPAMKRKIVSKGVSSYDINSKKSTRLSTKESATEQLSYI